MKSVMVYVVVSYAGVPLVAKSTVFVFWVCIKEADPFHLRGVLGFFMALPFVRSAEAGAAPRAVVFGSSARRPSFRANRMLPFAFATCPRSMRGVTGA